MLNLNDSKMQTINDSLKTKEQLKAEAERLIAEANAAGVVITIINVPKQPLAMGHHEMVCEVSERHAY